MVIDRDKIKAINDYYIRVWDIRRIESMINQDYERARWCSNYARFYRMYNEKLENDKKTLCD